MGERTASGFLRLDDTGIYSRKRKSTESGHRPFNPWSPYITNSDPAEEPLAKDNDFASWSELFEQVAIASYYEDDHNLISQSSTAGITLGAMTRDVNDTPRSSLAELCDKVDSSPNVPKRKNKRLSTRAVLILEDWLSQHQESPYPTDDDKCLLEACSGLERAQINTWFANARKRRKMSLGQNELQARVLPHMGSLHPFERWLTLGLEFEPASVTAISQALTKSKQPEQPTRIRGVDRCTNWQYFGGGPSSVSSLEIRSYAANRSVDADQQRLRSFRSLEPLRRRCISDARKAQSSEKTQVDQDETAKRFQCTFCRSSFRRKHEWQRHEKSRHLPLEKWMCTPHGGTAVDPATCAIVCAFCGEHDPTPEHLERHGFVACAQRPLHERTFYRKDHLRQHLRLSHGVSTWAGLMEEWKTVPETVRSRCGFCNRRFETWQTRVDHIAGHFLDGTSMVDWFGDWGFEDEVTSILEHATLPELRQTTLNIFKNSPVNESGTIPTLWEASSVFESSDWPSFETCLPSTTSEGIGDYYSGTAVFDFTEFNGADHVWVPDPGQLSADETVVSNDAPRWEVML